MAIAASFPSGFAFQTILTTRNTRTSIIKKVTGIGGIFFKCKDPGKMKDWYKVYHDLYTNQLRAVFEWYQGTDNTKKGFTQWSPFKEKTKYFEPSTKDLMINYRVENLETLVEELKKNGITIVEPVESAASG